jgi:hypothetical protein
MGVKTPAIPVGNAGERAYLDYLAARLKIDPQRLAQLQTVA